MDAEVERLESMSHRDAPPTPWTSWAGHAPGDSAHPTLYPDFFFRALRRSDPISYAKIDACPAAPHFDKVLTGRQIPSAANRSIVANVSAGINVGRGDALVADANFVNIHDKLYSKRQRPKFHSKPRMEHLRSPTPGWRERSWVGHQMKLWIIASRRSFERFGRRLPGINWTGRGRRLNFSIRRTIYAGGIERRPHSMQIGVVQDNSK